VYRILQKAEGKVKLLIHLLFFLGLRVSEALQLKKKDITFGERLSERVKGHLSLVYTYFVFIYICC
jgi:integrase